MASLYTSSTSKYPPILMTQAVLMGLQQEAPTEKTVMYFIRQSKTFNAGSLL